MQITEFLLKKFRNKEIVLVDSDNFVYEIVDINTNTNKIVVRIKDSILTNPKAEIIEDDGVENRAANKDWNERTSL